ncbi:ABC transporter domain protein [Chlamydia psittaci 84/55]|nr:ABC transporter domain protein [Chlamydia psittaci 84/55]
MEAKKTRSYFPNTLCFSFGIRQMDGVHLCSDKKLLMEEELISFYKYSGL